MTGRAFGLVRLLAITSGGSTCRRGTAGGRAIRMLTIVYEQTRECLSIDVARWLTSEDVLDRLSDLFVSSGVPATSRDNGQSSPRRECGNGLHESGERRTEPRDAVPTEADMDVMTPIAIRGIFISGLIGLVLWFNFGWLYALVAAFVIDSATAVIAVGRCELG